MVSVVIPAYNVTKTLPRLLDCLLNQTWQNLQIILIDDGSEDGTAAMAKEAAEKDPRLTVITQGNLGISYARNCRWIPSSGWSGGRRRTAPSW